MAYVLAFQRNNNSNGKYLAVSITFALNGDRSSPDQGNQTFNSKNQLEALLFGAKIVLSQALFKDFTVLNRVNRLLLFPHTLYSKPRAFWPSVVGEIPAEI